MTVGSLPPMVLFYQTPDSGEKAPFFLLNSTRIQLKPKSRSLSGSLLTKFIYYSYWYL